MKPIAVALLSPIWIGCIQDSAWAAEAETETIESGRAQLEFKLAESRNNRDAGFIAISRTTPLLIRIGVSANAELRVETEGRAKIETTSRESGKKSTLRGTTDTSIGARWRQYDAEEKTGKPAIAWLLALGLPTGSNTFKGDSVTTNLKFASQWGLGDETTIAVMPGLLHQRSTGGKWFTAPTFAVTLGKNWTPAWRSVAEVVSSRLTNRANGGNDATFNLGNTYSLNNMFEMELVYLRGIVKATPENNLALGINVKF